MTAHEDGWYEMKSLYIARAEEAAKMYGLVIEQSQKGIWIRFTATLPPDGWPVFSIQSRGWKNASDAFVKASTEWYQKRDVE